MFGLSIAIYQCKEWKLSLFPLKQPLRLPWDHLQYSHSEKGYTDIPRPMAFYMIILYLFGLELFGLRFIH